MRSACAVLLLASLAGCTQYQPVVWNGRGSWAEARAAAGQSRSAAPVRAARPIAGETVVGSDEGRHLVLPGETLPELAHRYGVPPRTLARVNAVQAPYAVHAGQVLSIPATTKVAAAPQVRPQPALARVALPVIATRELAPPVPRVILASEQADPGSSSVLAAPAMTPAEMEATRRAAAKVPPALSGEGFLWPVAGEVASGFGEKPNGWRNDGINILAPLGASVVAAENGVVVYAGDEIPGYGNMLLISHADGFTTAYAHNRDLLVRVGEVVGRGQEVATVGATGGIGLPQLHFELRQGKEPIDPVAQLGEPETRLASTR